MSQQSAIEWTDSTWNPVTGCDRVSPGCAHCYALDLAARLKSMGNPRYQVDGDPKTSGPGFGVTLHPDKLEEPLRWRKPRRVFVNSMSDLFHEAVPFDYVDRVFTTMLEAEQHIFQVLTKRPERMLEYFRHGADFMGLQLGDLEAWPNVWLGVSIENRRYVHRADLLRETPAAVRFISAEPLLGPLVNLPVPPSRDPGRPEVDAVVEAELDLTDIDWLIVGGESGPQHRRMDPQWVRDLRDACLAGRAVAGYSASGNQDGLRWSETQYEPTGVNRTAFFFKQWGGHTPKASGRELDGRTWDEFPAARERVPA